MYEITKENMKSTGEAGGKGTVQANRAPPLHWLYAGEKHWRKLSGDELNGKALFGGILRQTCHRAVCLFRLATNPGFFVQGPSG
jgi:hypothetical protein